MSYSKLSKNGRDLFVRLIVCCFFGSLVAVHAETEITQEMKTLFTSGNLNTHRLLLKDGKFEVLVDQGNESEAIAYYNLINSDYLDITDNDITKIKLNDLLNYVGFSDISADAIDILSSEVLMNMSTAQDEILVTRFFAPKIMDVSGKTNPREYGWRKLLRLNVRPDSEASNNGISSLFLLYNYFSKEPKFPASPVNAIQAILVRNSSNTIGFPVYFFVFGNADKDYILGNFLKASFDAATQNPDEKYFVPRACAQCHGAKDKFGATEGKVNYLDTDHWYDRASRDNDFSEIKTKDVLPDGGSLGLPIFRNFGVFFSQYKKAFEVYKKLNLEILQQNNQVNPGGFQARATETWLNIHRDRIGPIKVIKRGIPKEIAWSKKSQTDRKLLPLLNQYCFRCHSSFAYHVFDKSEVLLRAKDMAEFIEVSFMPLDQELSEEVKGDLIGLLEQLQTENQ